MSISILEKALKKTLETQENRPEDVFFSEELEEVAMRREVCDEDDGWMEQGASG